MDRPVKRATRKLTNLPHKITRPHDWNILVLFRQVNTPTICPSQEQSSCLMRWCSCLRGRVHKPTPKWCSRSWSRRYSSSWPSQILFPHFQAQWKTGEERVTKTFLECLTVLPEKDSMNYICAMDNFFTMQVVSSGCCKLVIGMIGTACVRKGWSSKEFKEVKDDRFNSLYYWMMSMVSIVCSLG